MPDVLDETKENQSEDATEQLEDHSSDRPVDEPAEPAFSMATGYIIMAAVLFMLLITNILTSVIVFKSAKNYITQKYREKDGIYKPGMYRGALFHIERKKYNLDSGDTPLFLDLELYLELDNYKMADEVWEKTSRIQHIINEIITNKPVDYFNSRSGIQRARRHILESVNKILDTGRVVNVYFTEFHFSRSGSEQDQSDTDISYPNKERSL